MISEKYIDDVVFGKCREIAKNVLDEKWPDITDGCDHYHSSIIKPYWAARLKPKRIFGTQYFYAFKNLKEKN